LLEPFILIITCTQGEYITLSLIAPFLAEMKNVHLKYTAEDTNIIMEIKTSMLDKCKIKFENSIGEKILIATMLDPRYRILF
jgi:hypothetical protein